MEKYDLCAASKEGMYCGSGHSAEVESSFRIHTVISLVLSTTHKHTRAHTQTHTKRK